MNKHPDTSTKDMFSQIAGGYDRCNHIFSLGIDHYWRRRLVKMLALGPGTVVADLCCGTGDMVFSLAKHSRAARIVGVDFSGQMIELAKKKVHHAEGRVDFRVGDAAELDFECDSLDAVTCVFGLRNVRDRRAVLGEMFRVLKPAGVVGICEFSLPGNRWLERAYWLYLSRIMPAVGRVVIGSSEPLRYLASSIDNWHHNVDIEKELAGAGFDEIRTVFLTADIVKLTVARK